MLVLSQAAPHALTPGPQAHTDPPPPRAGTVRGRRLVKSGVRRHAQTQGRRVGGVASGRDGDGGCRGLA